MVDSKISRAGKDGMTSISRFSGDGLHHIIFDHPAELRGGRGELLAADGGGRARRTYLTSDLLGHCGRTGTEGSDSIADACFFGLAACVRGCHLFSLFEI